MMCLVTLVESRDQHVTSVPVRYVPGTKPESTDVKYTSLLQLSIRSITVVKPPAVQGHWKNTQSAGSHRSSPVACVLHPGVRKS